MASGGAEQRALQTDIEGDSKAQVQSVAGHPAIALEKNAVASAAGFNAQADPERHPHGTNDTDVFARWFGADHRGSCRCTEGHGATHVNSTFDAQVQVVREFPWDVQRFSRQ